MLATYYYIYPFVGGTFGLICFCIVALGGFGSIEGAFIAGILVGVVETVGGYLLDPSYKLAIVFAMYLVTVWIRPQGLRGIRAYDRALLSRSSNCHPDFDRRQTKTYIFPVGG